MSTDSRAPEVSEIAPVSSKRRKRIAIFIVTYNAAHTLRPVLDRIPRPIWDKVEEVFVFDDSSKDDTYLVGLGYKALHGHAKLTIVRNEKNLGYGGNQIRGYQYAIARGYDIVALLHGDGQYAPEVLGDLLEPLETGQADAVFGSRMMVPLAALRGGMPAYKYIGNKILTTFENSMLGTSYSEFHSGYRVYSCHALKQIPFEKNTHDFHFDTQIIIQFHAAGLRIVERPIPTYYGDEICHVNGMRYAKDVVKSILQYQLHEFGVEHHPEYQISRPYALKHSPYSSHSQLIDLVGPPSAKILDIGCGDGELSHVLKTRGHEVVGIDREQPQYALDRFIQADISRGLPLDPEDRFDVILLADVLEHMSDPARLLEEARRHLAPDGRILVSIPNAVHFSMRLQILAGEFNYTNRGILDEGHLRFFTAASILRLFKSVDLEPVARRTTPIPWEKVIPKALGSFVRDTVEKVDHRLSRLAPNVFAYQHIYELKLVARNPLEGAAVDGESSVEPSSEAFDAVAE